MKTAILPLLALALSLVAPHSAAGFEGCDVTGRWAFSTEIASGDFHLRETGGGLAGHTDWRLPNRRELESLVNLQTASRATFLEFHTSCAPACTVLTCSCTVSSSYGSSSSFAGAPQNAWAVFFNGGDVGNVSKSASFSARAVRAGA